MVRDPPGLGVDRSTLTRMSWGTAVDPRPTTKPHALMIRAVRPGISALCCVPEYKMATFLEGGWTVLVCDAQIRSNDIEDTYRSDLKERL